MEYLWNNVIVPFADSMFLQSVVTGAVGFFAIYIYRKQRRDIKSEAALAIYYELKNAETTLRGLKDKFFAVERPELDSKTIMDYQSWNKSKHLFAQILSAAEWKDIDTFYTNCLAYDTAVKENNSYFDRTTKALGEKMIDYSNVMLTEYHKNKPSTEEAQLIKLDNIQKDLIEYQNLMTANSIYYKPSKPVIEARLALVGLDVSITTSTGGRKLQEIAKIKDL